MKSASGKSFWGHLLHYGILILVLWKAFSLLLHIRSGLDLYYMLLGGVISGICWGLVYWAISCKSMHILLRGMLVCLGVLCHYWFSRLYFQEASLFYKWLREMSILGFMVVSFLTISHSFFMTSKKAD